MPTPPGGASTAETGDAPGEDVEAVRMLAALVALAPTNLEDPPTGRYEKPNYLAAVDWLVRTARGWGLPTQVYDPTADSESAHEFLGGPRPSVVIDLDVAAPERVLILAHYDVVPVPNEQRPRWKSPPHILTRRSDGRLYGRGSNDDLGSGVVASLLALKRLADGPPPPRSVRLLVCCDEETGGAGGVEAIKDRDARRPAGDPGRLLAGDVALIPDGSPHTTAGSCGVAFLDASFDGAQPLPAVLAAGEMLVGLHEKVRAWRSAYPSPDWPDHGAPEAVLTGRATVTKLDLRSDRPTPAAGELLAVHAETDAANQIAESVTLVATPAPAGQPTLLDRARRAVVPPYHVEPAVATALTVPSGAEAIQVVGVGAHGGYPHRGHNPVPATLGLLRQGTLDGWLRAPVPLHATFAVDLRLTPEMTLEDGLPSVRGWVGEWSRSSGVPVRIDAPPGRCRGGYALPLDHPAVLRLARLLEETVGGRGVFGEYGGTDASSLAEIRTSSGEPMPAIVFGSMDREANIHQAEESVDPRLLVGVSRAIERFIREP